MPPPAAPFPTPRSGREAKFLHSFGRHFVFYLYLCTSKSDVMKKFFVALSAVFAIAFALNSNAMAQDTIKSQDLILINPEIVAEYPSGAEGLKDFIRRNLETPKNNKCTGTVYVQFYIEVDGTLTNAEVLEDIGCGCGRKTLKLISKMPNWVPGTINGKPVRTRQILQLNFTAVEQE